jgi:hypothetical protein
LTWQKNELAVNYAKDALLEIILKKTRIDHKFLIATRLQIFAMKYEIVKNPMGLIEFTLDKEEKVTAEAAAMVFHGKDSLKESLVLICLC